MKSGRKGGEEKKCSEIYIEGNIKIQKVQY